MKIDLHKIPIRKVVSATKLAPRKVWWPMVVNLIFGQNISANLCTRKNNATP